MGRTTDVSGVFCPCGQTSDVHTGRDWSRESVERVGTDQVQTVRPLTPYLLTYLSLSMSVLTTRLVRSVLTSSTVVTSASATVWQGPPHLLDGTRPEVSGKESKDRDDLRRCHPTYLTGPN